jgi:hypothetical protein
LLGRFGSELLVWWWCCENAMRSQGTFWEKLKVTFARAQKG